MSSGDDRSRKRRSDNAKADAKPRFEIRFSKAGSKRLMPRLDGPLRLVAEGRRRVFLNEPSPEESEREVEEEVVQQMLPGIDDED